MRIKDILSELADYAVICLAAVAVGVLVGLFLWLLFL